MISQVFAQYLVNKGLLTPAEIQEALESRRTVQAKLGVVAINQGYLTAEQVEEIHQLQFRIDKRFGEIAVSEHYLSQEQLAALLAEQGNDYLNFGQALVDKGFLSLETLENVITAYKQAAELEQPSDLLLSKEWLFQYLSFAKADEDAVLYCDYVALFLRVIVRFLDASPLLVAAEAGEAKERWAACQSMTGDITLHSCLWVEDNVLLEIASRYSGERMSEINELALDSMGEFLNVANGLFCINLSNLGLDSDLHPQSVEKRDTLGTELGCQVVIDTGFGTMTLVLGRQ
ncbi:chemotaxis protein CheX [Anaerospora hongkongensis]|uniref:chemotaxis protein CheX n=1 Tax=Anaerospora hongkongensis TaxID=244830 RepID=UPI00289F11B5|nr:chemotaxis protein CheX [Anaerospora hongkongensis]